MQPLINEAIEAALNVERDYKPSGTIRLYPSEAGGCARATMLRIHNAPKKSFPLQAKKAMEDGIAYEDNTLKLLRRHYGHENILEQLPLQTTFWSGKADFVIFHETPQVMIVEHKATGQKWFDYKGSLPNPKHVVQLSLYKTIYRDKYGFEPELRLFYRAWQNWAEFILEPEGAVIRATGWVNGKEREVMVPINLEALKGKLEFYFTKGLLPKRVKEEDKDKTGCTFKGEASCPFFDSCWPKEKSLAEVKS